MSITIIEMGLNDNVGTSRSTINSNFQKLKNGIDDLEGYIDINSNVLSLNDRATTPIDTVIIAGLTGLITARGLDINSILGIVNSGPLTVSGVSQFNNDVNMTGLLDLTGDLNLSNNIKASGSIVLDSIDSKNVVSDNIYQGVGNLSPLNGHYFALDYTSSVNPGVDDLVILGSGVVGQEIILSCEGLVGGSTSGYIDITGTDSQPIIQVGSSSGTKIELTGLYSNVKLKYNGLYWILIGGHDYIII